MRNASRQLHKCSETDELCCTTCGSWKAAAANFRKEALRYARRCNKCDALRDALRKGHKGRHPSNKELKEAITNGVVPVGSLTQAGHTKGQGSKPKPLSTRAREELRERREESEGKPSMCYLVGMEGDNTAVKIGHSTNVFRRMAQYQSGNPRKLKVLGLLPGGQAKERELHQKFMRYHRADFVGEWFQKAPEIMNHFAAGPVRVPAKLGGLDV